MGDVIQAEFGEKRCHLCEEASTFFLRYRLCEADKKGYLICPDCCVGIGEGALELMTEMINDARSK